VFLEHKLTQPINLQLCNIIMGSYFSSMIQIIPFYQQLGLINQYTKLLCWSFTAPCALNEEIIYTA